ncbi:MAG: bifunctional phosphoribosylaminoimidazolecarboxamide formyltransferase/IMP cyclohydrolase [Deltaproteobacteria bacterium]|nr:bifunctional phosphoribosylaminoimidazolecarboxamide formyltransferase/IMP cyclohydrolase [Deltaproteobacteria bacterium]MBI3295242.1 bifunctional phosphoribosylaminoimidazolecarboxamide formyltransferase/IMP cyclohydrolase [Deltaproteobacteria bacterium]
MKNALLSVTDKSYLAELALGLGASGWNLYATSGTLKVLEGTPGVKVLSVGAITDFPEMMDGRVKTLSPKIFAGILARRDHKPDLDDAAKFGVVLFDLVVVNLYAFQEHLGKPADEQAAFIDIGGPSLIRAAAKNSMSVCVLTDPKDYGRALEVLQEAREFPRAFRAEMATKAFALTSRYDGMIAGEWGGLKGQALRYGENPHQEGRFAPSPLATWKLLQGKELSYNNMLDADAAYRLAQDFSDPAVAIIKHTNPCGVASGPEALSALYLKALECDSQSAFGGIVGVNRPVDGELALEMGKIFLEVVVAPEFTEEAKSILVAKKNLRLIEWPSPVWAKADMRLAMGGMLTQTLDHELGWTDLKVVTTKKPDAAAMSDLKFAWTVAKHAKSNAIVLVKKGVTLGVGAGQMSRVDSVDISLKKAAGKTISGSVLASDAFFPFRDNIDRLKGLGISAIVSPGGSQRDNEVIAACEEHGIAMVFTGVRHFRH